MKLQSASLEEIGGVAKSTLHNARNRWASRRGFLLTLQAEGLIGLGEASPLPGYSPDEPEAVERELRAFVRGLTELPMQPELVEDRCSSLASPSARFAAEIALLDLLARSRSCSLHQFFGPGAAGVPRSGLLQSFALGDLIEEAREKVARGIRCLKLKVGALSIEEESHRIRSLSSALGPSITLRLDANGAFSMPQARALFSALRGVCMDCIEEPVAPEQWPLLYRDSLFNPEDSLLAPLLAADESLSTMAAEHLDARAVAVLVLKPSVLGFFGARRLAEEGIRKGKKLIVTHLFDGPVALAASCELALSLPPETLLPCGLDEHDALGALGNEEVLQLRSPGWISAAPGAGLGFPLR